MEKSPQRMNWSPRKEALVWCAAISVLVAVGCYRVAYFADLYPTWQRLITFFIVLCMAARVRWMLEGKHAHAEKRRGKGTRVD